MNSNIETRGYVIGFKEKKIDIAPDEDLFFGWFDNQKAFKNLLGMRRRIFRVTLWLRWRSYLDFSSTGAIQ